MGELHYLQFETNPETLRAAPDQQSIPQYESITYWQNTTGQTMFIKRTQFFMGYGGVDGLYDSFALLGRKSGGMYRASVVASEKSICLQGGRFR